MSSDRADLMSSRSWPSLLASKPRQALVLVILCDALILMVYIWVVSAGSWTQWPTRWSAYDTLATAFRHGHLYLEAQPESALLALSDPYDPASRSGIAFPQDVSLYKGHFYLYFGPVPALILVLARSFISGPIGDQYLVFAFVSGILLLQSYLIVMIWRRFFRDGSAWVLVPVLLVGGLMNPWSWILSTASLYSAAITGGQFFFLAGLVLALGAFRETGIAHWKLAIAGLLWVLAVGCRITLVLPVAFMTAFLAIRIVLAHRRAGMLSRAIAPTFLLAGVLAAGLAGLGWYNWARFGSIFETGITYQLAGVPLQNYGGEISSPIYIVQNSYNYLLNPPRLKYAFPYFSPLRGATGSVLPIIALPAVYHTQEVAGLLFSAPFIPLGLLPLIGVFRPKGTPVADDEARRFRWLVIALASAFLSSFAFFAAFFWAAERYLADFLPGLFLLSVMGVWQVERYFASRRIGRVLYRVTFWALAAASIIASVLLAMSFHAGAFRQLNPVFWRQLGNLFRP